MTRRPHSRLIAAQARTAEQMRQAAQQLREDAGPVRPEVRMGLARLLEAVADQQSSATTGIYVWDATANIADALLARPLDESLVSAIREEKAGQERFEHPRDLPR